MSHPLKQSFCERCTPDFTGQRRPLLADNGTRCHGCGWQVPLWKVTIVRAIYETAEVKVRASCESAAQDRALERARMDGGDLEWERGLSCDSMDAGEAEIIEEVK